MRLTKYYASALLGSIPKEDTTSIFQELLRVANILGEAPKVVNVLQFQALDFQTIRNLLATEIESRVLNFLEVLTQDGLLHRLDTIIEDYRLLLVEENLLYDVRVFSARELSESAKANVLNTIESKWGENYTVEYHINPKIIGGIRLEVNGAVIDTTFRSRIDQILREVQHES